MDLRYDPRYNIELLNANAQLQARLGGRLSVQNEETGVRTEVALP